MYVKAGWEIDPQLRVKIRLEKYSYMLPILRVRQSLRSATPVVVQEGTTTEPRQNATE